MSNKILQVDVTFSEKLLTAFWRLELYANSDIIRLLKLHLTSLHIVAQHDLRTRLRLSLFLHCTIFYNNISLCPNLRQLSLKFVVETFLRDVQEFGA